MRYSIGSMNDFTDRAIRAACLDPDLYEEVEADRDSLGQAALLVVLSSVAAGIGVTGMAGPAALVFASVAALLGWVLWAALIYFIGARLLPEPQTRTDLGELLRTVGFASAPGVLRVLGVVPVFGPLLVVLVSIWMLAAMVVAVRQALDYESTLRAIGVCLIGFVSQGIILAVFLG